MCRSTLAAIMGRTAAETGSPEQAAVIRSAIEHSSDGHIEAVLKAVEGTDAIPYTRALAERHAASAKASVGGLPESPYKAALLRLADFAVGRKH